MAIALFVSDVACLARRGARVIDRDDRLGQPGADVVLPPRAQHVQADARDHDRGAGALVQLGSPPLRARQLEAAEPVADDALDQFLVVLNRVGRGALEEEEEARAWLACFERRTLLSVSAPSESPGGTAVEAPVGIPSATRERRDVFISYAREDTEFVRRLHERLLESGMTVYVDVDLPKASDDWQAELYAWIEASNTFVAVLSADFSTSPYVGREVEHAVAQGKRIRPIQVSDVGDERLPQALRTPQWTDFRDSESFEPRFADLVEVLNTDADWVQSHTRFLVAANDWNARGRDRSLLLGRSDLRDADEWLARQAGKEPPPSELQTEYILASRAAAQRRQRTILAAVSVALAVAIGLAVLALLQRGRAITNEKQAKRESRLALSREVAANAVAQLPVDRDRGLRLAIEAARIAPTLQARDALRRALGVLKPGPRPPAVDEPVADAAFMPDGRALVTMSPDGTVTLSTLRPAGPHATFHDSARVTAFGIRPDGSLVATANEDGAVRIWDFRTRRPMGVLTSGDREPLTSVAFSPDGRLIIAPSVGGSINFWSATSLRRRRTLQMPGAAGVDRALFDPSGRRILTQSESSGVLVLWDAATATLMARIDASPGRAEGNLRDVSFTPDGDGVVIVDSDESVRVRRVLRDKTSVLLPGHGGGDVVSAGLSRDSRLLATGGENGTLRVWDLETGIPVAELHAANGMLTTVAFDVTGKLILTVSSGQRVKLYACELCEMKLSALLATSRARHVRELTPDERAKYLHGA
jgi:hypothetical protein